MNRKINVLTIVFLIIFLPGFSFGQSLFRQYTDLINQAEILITEHNELLALNKYDSAFKLKSRLQQIFIMLQLALFNKIIGRWRCNIVCN